MYKWQQVKALRAKGESIKGIARQLNLSKNTVRKYLRGSGPPEFKRRDYERMLDDYDGVIREMLGKGYIGTRIHNELREIGYNGSLSSVHRYIAGIRAEEKIRGKMTTRVETLPGRQMQYDWKEWVLSVGGKPIKLYIHEVVLSYSRKKYYTYSVSITAQDVIRAIAEGIEFFQGVPDELVIDNPKQMVITHRKDGVIRYNDEFLKFCGLYGLDPNPCANYRARTKGKAERPFYYLQEHLLKGLEIEELFQFDRLLKDFTDQYNARPHSSLKESPDERFSRELKHLRSLPVVEPTVLYERQTRKVTNDGYISWNGNFYPVPMRLCMREVMVESIFGRIIKVYDSKGEMVKEHQITLFNKGIRPDHPEHESINKEYRDKKERLRSAVVEVKTKIYKARFPFIKTLEQFDFSFQPGLGEKEVLRLNSLEFIENKGNLVFLGPPGVGKTHLAVAFGIKACQTKYRVLFMTAQKLIEDLMLSVRDGSITAKLLAYSRLNLLIIDELRYMPVTKEQANLLFQLVSMRYEKGSIILTSNYNFEDWGEIFQDNVVVAAIIDRIVHHAKIFYINGSSYRLKNKLKKGN